VRDWVGNCKVIFLDKGDESNETMSDDDYFLDVGVGFFFLGCSGATYGTYESLCERRIVVSPKHTHACRLLPRLAF
jgi:hypothetical protein